MIFGLGSSLPDRRIHLDHGSQAKAQQVYVIAGQMRLHDFGKAVCGFFDVGSAVECAQTEIALPAGSEPAPWCSH